MFAVILKYVCPMETVEAHTVAHRAFLDEYYAQGVLLMSGRQNPPTGGVLVAKAESRAALEAILAQDPFQVHGVAEYAIYEFTAAKAQPFLKEWLES